MRRSRRYVRHSVFMPMDRAHLAKRKNTATYRSCCDRLAGTRTKSALNLEVLSRSFAPVRDFLVFHDLPLIETAEAGSFDRRDVDEHIFTAGRQVRGRSQARPSPTCRQLSGRYSTTSIPKNDAVTAPAVAPQRRCDGATVAPQRRVTVQLLRRNPDVTAQPTLQYRFSRCGRDRQRCH